MILQPILNIAEICAKKGVQRAIISPGSRNALLTIAFARHPDIQSFSISDERSAAFIGLGMAQLLKQPVALICTSGSAAYNYAPAVAEAFFQEIPLIVLTADRPKEWIHQHDGQTIYQTEIFGNHVKKSFEVGSDYSHSDAVWHIERTINEAINLANAEPKGPVHVNIPIREPFYPVENEVVKYDKGLRIIEQLKPVQSISTEDWRKLLSIFESVENILIAGGQADLDEEMNEVLSKIQEDFKIPVLGDAIANLTFALISKHDIFLKKEASDLAPELLITFGKSFISKGFKTYIRNNKPKYHWHLQTSEHLIDTFQSLTTLIPIEAKAFFQKLYQDVDYQQFLQGDDDGREGEYLSRWQQKQEKASQYLNKFFDLDNEFSEFEAIKYLLDNLPNDCLVHTANSMAVRYVNYVGVNPDKNIEVFANRGTSGIDGCVSTAVGAALATDKLVFLLVGDVAFFYDRNGLWNNYLPDNLRIVLMNNHGGGIFRIIDGPNKQAELGEYFETKQNFKAKLTAEESGMEYLFCDSREGFLKSLPEFIAGNNSAKLFEIETVSEINAEVFKRFKEDFNK